jgi:hypothetical protein
VPFIGPAVDLDNLILLVQKQGFFGIDMKAKYLANPEGIPTREASRIYDVVYSCLMK